MASLKMASASVVILGRQFTPALMTPDVLRSLFPKEKPKGVGTDVISQLDYPRSKFSITMDTGRLQVRKGSVKPAHLSRISEVVSLVLEGNPLVALTAVGLNFEGFVSYRGGTDKDENVVHAGGEARFIESFTAHGALSVLTGAQIGQTAMQLRYEFRSMNCRLDLRSDALLDDNEGVAIALNVNKNLEHRNDVDKHMASFPEWHAYFREIGKRLGSEV